MKTIASFLLGVMGIIIGIGCQALVMINGWGVQPKYWVWIIVIAFVGYTTAQVFIEVSKNLTKDI
jgi:hypothetical protein